MVEALPGRRDGRTRGPEHPRDEQGRSIPLLREQMPDAGNETAIVAYETTSEGTPIPPSFPDTPEGRLDLVRYWAENCTTFAGHQADPEASAVILFGEGKARAACARQRRPVRSGSWATWPMLQPRFRRNCTTSAL